MHRELTPAVQPFTQGDLVRDHPRIGGLDAISNALRALSAEAPAYRRLGRTAVDCHDTFQPILQVLGMFPQELCRGRAALAMTLENQRHHPTLEFGRELEV